MPIHRLLPEAGEGEGALLVAAAFAAAGPLPAYHPDALAAALAAGNVGYVSAALRRALETTQNGVCLQSVAPTGLYIFKPPHWRATLIVENQAVQSF